METFAIGMYTKRSLQYPPDKDFRNTSYEFFLYADPNVYEFFLLGSLSIAKDIYQVRESFCDSDLALKLPRRIAG